MRALSFSPNCRPWRARIRKRRQGHARRRETACVTSSNSARIPETAKFTVERRLRVYAKSFSPYRDFSPASAIPRKAPASRKHQYYTKSPVLSGGGFVFAYDVGNVWYYFRGGVVQQFAKLSCLRFQVETLHVRVGRTLRERRIPMCPRIPKLSVNYACWATFGSFAKLRSRSSSDGS